MVKSEPQVQKWGPLDNPPALDGNAQSGIPGRVDEESIVGMVDKGTFVPGSVDSAGIAPRVDRGKGQ